jgi:hypothetical protein
LARVALRHGDLLQAERNAIQINAYLEQNGPQGLELPILVYLTCARVFQALEDTPRLQRILENGRKELQTRLGRISESSWRDTFLDAIQENRELMAFESTGTQNPMI